MERLKRRADFVAASAAASAGAAGSVAASALVAASAGKKIAAPAFVLQARKRTDDGPPRVGFTVSKKVGNAVERNRVRRRLREIVRLSPAGNMNAGHDYVLIGRRAALRVPFERIAQDFAGALRRMHAGRAEAVSG